MKKAMIGIVFGIVAGVIDAVPMLLQKLTWDAVLSAFSMWVVIGLFVSLHQFKIPVLLGSVITAFLVLAPAAILIAWKEPFSLVPISIMTLVLSSLLGLGIGFIKKKWNTD
jgi:hypothetical protein